jgi:hypothetical protein
MSNEENVCELCEAPIGECDHEQCGCGEWLHSCGECEGQYCDTCDADALELTEDDEGITFCSRRCADKSNAFNKLMEELEGKKCSVCGERANVKRGDRFLCLDCLDHDEEER